MATRLKPRPAIGDHAWLVSWCHELAFDEYGDLDRDRCKETECRVATRESAERLARKVWPVVEKTFGAVRYSEAVFQPYDEGDADLYPHAGYWEEIGDAEYYEGPDDTV